MSQVITESYMHRAAPSIFASEPHFRTSGRYGFVPTIEVLRAFESEGWSPVRVQQTRVRDESRIEFTRHMVRLRQLHNPIEVGDSLMELVLTNSHDGSSAYRLDIGLFRLVCSNGMVSSLGKAGGLRVCHGKNVVEGVIEGSYELLKEAPQLTASVERFQEVQLEREEQRLFAGAALEMRYGKNWNVSSPIRPDDVLLARRRSDNSPFLWNTLNNVQENLLKGGVSGRSAKSGRRFTTRPIKSVVEDVRLNRALWTLTQEMAKLKAA